MRWLLWPLVWLDEHTRIGRWDSEWFADLVYRIPLLGSWLRERGL